MRVIQRRDTSNGNVINVLLVGSITRQLKKVFILNRSIRVLSAGRAKDATTRLRR